MTVPMWLTLAAQPAPRPAMPILWRPETVSYYYICDNCGSIADISDEPHPDGVQWACGDCESTALWEFADKDKAMLHSSHIRDSRFAAKMAGLDQARAALDEHEATR